MSGLYSWAAGGFVQLPYLKKSVFNLYTKMVVIGSVFWIVGLVQLDSHRSVQQSNLIENSSIDTSWRQTKFGWQNSNLWQHRTTEAPIVSRIHPFIFTAAVLLAVLGLMIWSSNEVELESLTDIKSPPRKAANASSVDSAPN